MDSLVRRFFNQNLQTFFEPLHESAIELSLLDGVIFKDLLVRPDGINEQLEKNGVDVRVEGGQVGSMRICYTPLPGIVTLQLRDVDIRVRPNALKTLGKVISKKIGEMIEGEAETDREDSYYEHYPSRDPYHHSNQFPSHSPPHPHLFDPRLAYSSYPPYSESPCPYEEIGAPCPYAHPSYPRVRSFEASPHRSSLYRTGSCERHLGHFPSPSDPDYVYGNCTARRSHLSPPPLGRRALYKRSLKDECPYCRTGSRTRRHCRKCGRGRSHERERVRQHGSPTRRALPPYAPQPIPTTRSTTVHRLPGPRVPSIGSGGVGSSTRSNISSSLSSSSSSTMSGHLPSFGHGFGGGSSSSSRVSSSSASTAGTIHNAFPPPDLDHRRSPPTRSVAFSTRHQHRR